MKEITSIEWLIEMIGVDRLSNIHRIEDIINEAKELHKNEIIEARMNIYTTGHLTAEQYYNEKYLTK